MNLEPIKRFLPVFKHLVYTVGLGILIIIIFFYLFLPSTTNHGETITVPDITKQHINDLDEILLTRSLRYEVNPDSLYDPSQEPLTVVNQYPPANARVKENRRVYVTLNSKQPPLIELPSFKDKSFKIIQISFAAKGLTPRIKKYVDQVGFMTVLEAEYNGRILEEGSMIPKGATIDLTIANGDGPKDFPVGNYINKPLDEMKVSIAGAGLIIGQIIRVDSPLLDIKEGDSILQTISVPLNYVLRQKPEFGDSVRLGDLVDLWVYQLANNDSTLNVDNQ